MRAAAVRISPSRVESRPFLPPREGGAERELVVTGAARAVSLACHGPVALVFRDAREHAAVAGADLLGVALRDELRAPRGACEERRALRHALRLLAERARDVDVRERLGDAFRVQHERLELLVARLTTAAQQRHAALPRETGGEAAQ